MYKPIDKLQHSFLDFNQPMGLKMNPQNRWIKMADLIPWDEFEAKYAEQFPSGKGNVAKPLRMALGALIIQTKFQYSDRELVEQITENPYLQYFIGLPGYQEEAPFDASTLVLFRKRISAEMLMEANEYLLARKDDDDNTPSASGDFSDSKNEEQEYQDNTDRIEVERAFSVDKRCYGMGCITTKLQETQLTSIALSVFVSNLFRMKRLILYTLFYLFSKWKKNNNWELQISV